MMSPVRLSRLKRLFVGSPLPTAQSRHERLARSTALAVFASDALSSVAYATEEILLVLVLAGTAALSYSIPISIAIAVLIAIVVSSYRQTIRAYPQGGGAYIVSKDNLGVPAGVEAVSDGVPAFKPPEAHNARIVLTVLGVILIVLFLGITFLAYDFGIAPRHEETVVSQLARHVFGGGALYFEIQAVTMLILLLAANTSFADFPRLSFFLARDRFIPRQFATQGDRLVFSNGILILSGLAALLLVIFGGDTHALIPLYAVGVFLSFTLSQASMVRRWLRLKEDGWLWRWWLNAIGALVTGLVMITIAATKFTHGAWIVVLLIPTLVAVFVMVHRHYEEVAVQLSLDAFSPPPPMTNTVLVLVGDIHRGVIKAIQYAQTLSPNAKAVFVETDPERTRRLEEKWGRYGMGVPLIVLTSPYRSLLGPLTKYVDHLQSQGENHVVTIVLPEFIPARWWQLGLHNQTAFLIKGAMLFRKNVIVTDVPYHLVH